MGVKRDLVLIYGAALLRSLGIGLLGVLLGIYLFHGGASSPEIGLVIATGLAGGAVATAMVSLRGDWFGRRRSLTVLALLSTVGGLGLLLSSHLSGLLPLAFIGMLNGMGTDRTAAFALEQAIIPGLVSAERRTWTFSWYNLVLDSGHALGALGAGIPYILQRWFAIDVGTSYKSVFLGYARTESSDGVFIPAAFVARGAGRGSATVARNLSGAGDQEDRCKAGGAVLARQFRWRIPDGCTGLLLVLPTLWSARAESRYFVFLGSRSKCGFTPGCGVAGTEN